MTSAPADAPLSLPLTARLGPVHIAVTDPERALVIWRDLVGLTEIARDAQEIRLGVPTRDGGRRTLIVLEPGAARPVVRNTSGLYHVAIHVPTRKDLARVTARLMAARLQASPTDHLVSEATYLWDLDGNGIEMTFETPWRGTFKSTATDFYAVTTDGRRHSGRDAIDLDSLFGELQADDDLMLPLPAGTRIGHIHLHVADLDKAAEFYGPTVGFKPFMLNHHVRMGDVGLDYMPHTVAFNTWSGAGAPQAPEGSSGLRHFTLEMPDAGSLSALEARLAAAGTPMQPRGDGFEATDPAGNRMRVTLAA